MNKRQKKKQEKKLINRMKNSRKSGETISITCSKPIYDKNGQLIDIRFHQPVIKICKHLEN